MKKYLLLSLTLLASSFAQAPAKPAQQAAPSLSASLAPERVEEVYITQGLVTTLTLKTKKPVNKITAGSKIVTADFDPDLKQLELRANVTEGATNLNVMIGDDVYRFIVFIVNDARRILARTYTLAAEEAEVPFQIGSSAPAMRPDAIDVITLIETTERLRMDGQFRREQGARAYIHAVNKTYSWNISPVTLHDVTYFPESDVLLFRVEVYNRTDKVLYLHSKQYRVLVGARDLPLAVRTQITPTIFPGQLDKVYLVAQGLRVDPRNNWELVLPPEGEAVRRALNLDR